MSLNSPACDELRKLTEKEVLFVDDWSFVNGSHCGFVNSEHFYCCEKSSKLPARSGGVDFPEPGVCGTESTSNKIIGGTEANIDDYPWMALLKYYKRKYF